MAYKAEGTVTRVSAMRSRGFSPEVEVEEPPTSTCSTKLPSKCPPVLTAVTPGTICVCAGSAGSNFLKPQ